MWIADGSFGQPRPKGSWRRGGGMTKVVLARGIWMRDAKQPILACCAVLEDKFERFERKVQCRYHVCLYSLNEYVESS